MGRLFAAAALGAAAFTQLNVMHAGPQQTAAANVVSRTDGAAGNPALLPPLPQGTKTVMGGVIGDIDQVRDQFKLKVFGGGKPVKILFDPRTRVFLDGKPISLSTLKTAESASVETTLDGSNIYAVSIHMLSHAPEGECQGQVLNFDPGNGKLTVSTALAREPIELTVPRGTPVFRKGEAMFVSAHTGTSDLVSGDLVSIKFRSSNDGRGVATQVAILATPGASFVFSGNISALDVPSGMLVVTDPRDKETYRLHFNPRLFPSQSFRLGDHVRVKARFNGSQYEASEINPT
ncbi:MAG: hypothetical protein ACRD3F_16315 [Acidobacteriaceae bacterium]